MAFANPKFAGEEAPYTKKYPRVRRALGHIFCDSCLGLTSAVLQCTLVVFNFSSGEPRKRKENGGEVAPKPWKKLLQPTKLSSSMQKIVVNHRLVQ